uniref:Peptidase A2 domain-containing protein n=1 Tax=Daphnia galeata TaxID=27404 RepID=A0A8J2RCC4_9CRUS|nr:unnamed protein product [Daphnia galeata]
MEAKKFFLELKINGCDLKMKMDTGCNDPIINRRKWQKIGEPKLDDTSIKRRSAMGLVPIKGIFNASITIDGKSFTLPLLVADDETTRSLIGRKWLPTLMNINWNQFFELETVHWVSPCISPKRILELRALAMKWRTKYFCIKLKLNKIEFDMILDSGATSSVAGESYWEKLGKPNLRPAERKMPDTSGNSIPLMGEFTVEVEYLNKTSQLPLLVSSNEKMPLIIGTNWFGHVDIDFNSIFASITFAEDAKTAKAKSVIILESKEMFKPVQSMYDLPSRPPGMDAKALVKCQDKPKWKKITWGSFDDAEEATTPSKRRKSTSKSFRSTA